MAAGSSKDIVVWVMGGGLATTVAYIALIPVQRRKIKADTSKVEVEGDSVTVRAATELLGGALPWVDELRRALGEAKVEAAAKEILLDATDAKLTEMTMRYGAMRARNSVLEILMQQGGLEVPPVHDHFLDLEPGDGV